MFNIANVPNLHYIIEFLIMNNVKEIIIASRHLREKIKELNKKHKYKARINPVSIKASSANFGDAVREVAEMKIIKDDFIIVSGDIITNINFGDALRRHYYIK